MMQEVYCDSDKVIANQKYKINKHILVTKKSWQCWKIWESKWVIYKERKPI